MIFVALTHAEAKRLKQLLQDQIHGWDVGDKVMAELEKLFPHDPPMPAELRAQIASDRKLLGDVMRQLGEQVRQ